MAVLFEPCVAHFRAVSFVLAAISLLAVFPFVYAFGYYPSYAAPLFQNAPAFDFWTWAFVIFSTLAIFGQDVGLWLGFDGHLFLSGQFLPGPVPVHFLQLLPQAWSVSLELMFYAIAPFLVRRHILFLLAIVIGCFVLQTIAYEFGLKGEPWGYRFFVFELSRFMLGALAYRLYALTRHWPIWRKWFCVPVAVLVLLRVPSGRRLQAAHAVHIDDARDAVSLLAGNCFKFDSWLGELKYPIYLIHLAFNIDNLADCRNQPAVEPMGSSGDHRVVGAFCRVWWSSPDKARQQRLRARRAVAVPQANPLQVVA